MIKVRFKQNHFDIENNIISFKGYKTFIAYQLKHQQLNDDKNRNFKLSQRK